MTKQWMAFVWFVIIVCGGAGLILSLQNSEGAIVLRNAVRLKQPTFEQLLDAIEQVESGGDSSVVGDFGKAVGNFQIWPIYVKDVNRILGVDKFTLADRWDTVKSRDMVRIYLKHYASEARLGREPTLEDMARIHNAGPNGYKKDCAKPYWRKVKARLKAK